MFSVARITGVANFRLRMWSSSKKHQLLLTWAPGPGVDPGSRGHEADALPLSYPHILVVPLFGILQNEKNTLKAMTVERY